MVNYTFIVPVYNCEKYVEECVRSIIKIGLKNIEIILIDDGSTDGSSELCEKMGLLYEYIRVYHQTNQGVSAARNKGIENAKGKYIVFADSDDTFDQQKARELFFDRDLLKDTDLAICGMTLEYFRKGKVYRKDKLVYTKTGILEPSVWHHEFLQLYALNQISPVWAKVFKKSVIIDNNIRFNTCLTSYEDLDFTIKYLSYCDNICIYNIPIYKYRQSEDEGNSARRLRKVHKLSQIVNTIEASIDCLIKRQRMDETPKKILVPLYSTLAREKISISSRKQIIEICEDFRDWYYSHCESSDYSDKYVGYLLNAQVNKIMFRRIYSRIRHSVAVSLKYSHVTIIDKYRSSTRGDKKFK